MVQTLNNAVLVFENVDINICGGYDNTTGNMSNHRYTLGNSIKTRLSENQIFLTMDLHEDVFHTAKVRLKSSVQITLLFFSWTTIENSEPEGKTG